MLKRPKACSPFPGALTFAFCILNFALLVSAFGGEPAPVKPPVATEIKPQPPPVVEAELQRVIRVPAKILPWRINPPPSPPPPENGKDPTVPLDSGPLPDLSAGDLVIKAGGEFKREVTADVKETLTLNTDVEIESIASESVLRAQQVRVDRELKTGRTMELFATGGVQLVTPDRRARGETLKYEVKYYPQGQEQRATYTIEGNRGRGVKATLWVGNDAIEAEKFISDVDTFRAQGFPAAVFVLPAKPGDPVAAPVNENAGVGLLPGLGFNAGSKVRIQADGELQFEIPLGRVRINRNVELFQEGAPGQPGIKISADEVVILLAPPEAGEASTGVFTGTLKNLECTGRVEIKAHPRTILCDKCVIDMQRNRLSMEMKNPKEDVRIFIRESAAAGKVIFTPKSLVVNMNSGEIQAAGAQRMDAFIGVPPSNRVAPVPSTAVTPAPTPKTAPKPK